MSLSWFCCVNWVSSAKYRLTSWLNKVVVRIWLRLVDRKKTYVNVNPVDPTGNIPLDTIWDFGNVLYDLYAGNPCDLAADLGAMAIPYLPARVTKIPKIANVAKKAKPPNFSSPCAGRKGHLMRLSDNLVSQLANSQVKFRKMLLSVENLNLDVLTNLKCPAPGGSTKTVRIRDDAGGHDFGAGNSQNRGSHFNDEAGNHYDY